MSDNKEKYAAIKEKLAKRNEEARQRRLNDEKKKYGKIISEPEFDEFNDLDDFNFDINDDLINKNIRNNENKNIINNDNDNNNNDDDKYNTPENKNKENINIDENDELNQLLEKKRKRKPPLNEKVLTGKNGIERIYEEFPYIMMDAGHLTNEDELLNLHHGISYGVNDDNISDILHRLMGCYQDWAYNMYPMKAYDDVLTSVNSLYKKKGGIVRSYLNNMRKVESNRFMDELMVNVAQDEAEIYELNEKKRLENEEKKRKRKELKKLKKQQKKNDNNNDNMITLGSDSSSDSSDISDTENDSDISNSSDSDEDPLNDNDMDIENDNIINKEKDDNNNSEDTIINKEIDNDNNIENINKENDDIENINNNNEEEIIINNNNNNNIEDKEAEDREVEDKENDNNNKKNININI